MKRSQTTTEVIFQAFKIILQVNFITSIYCKTMTFIQLHIFFVSDTSTLEIQNNKMNAISFILYLKGMCTILVICQL